MFTVPLVSIGVILVLLLFNMNVTLPVFIGGVLLIGIVVNNGIVMIGYINRLRRRGDPRVRRFSLELSDASAPS
jgi:HAE1 family hydrophobic/amphiphilic exporter-1